MNTRARGWLHGLWAAFVVSVLFVNSMWPPPGLEGDWMWPTGLMAFPVAGALVLTLRPGNAIGRILTTIGAAMVVSFLFFWWAMTNPGSPLSPEAEALATLPVVIQFAGLLALLHLFPTGRPIGPRHARVVNALAWWTGAATIVVTIQPGPLPDSGRPNPFGIGPEWMTGVDDAFLFGLPLFAALGVGALIARRRRAAAIERAQLKWFFAGGLAVMGLLVMITPVFPDDSTGLVRILEGLWAVLCFWSLPAAIVVAITRYRLYDIDRIISRTAAYAIVAGTLLGVYAVSVIALQAILPVRGSGLAVAGSTLAALALFSPLRRSVQTALDRRFNRSRYEAERVIDAFSRRLRQEVDLDTVTADLSDVVIHTMQPATLHLWLRAPDRMGDKPR